MQGGGENNFHQGESKFNEKSPLNLEIAHLLENSSPKQFASKVFRTLHWNVLPFTTLLVLFCLIDRGNAGYVAGDLCRELHLTDSDYGLGVSVFGIGYITSQIPSNYVLRKLGASTWFAVLLITWGAVASCFSFVKNKVQFYILRVLLGIAEGGTFPGVWYYLSLFFPQNYLTFPTATTEAAICAASIVASPLAALCLSIGSRVGITGWRLLFAVEGVIPILYGIYVYFTLPSSLEDASYLTHEEKEWLQSQQPQHEPERNLMKEIRTVLRKPAFYVLGANGIARGALFALATNWTTLIISQILDSDRGNESCANSPTEIKYVLLTAVPFTVAGFFSLWIGHKATNSKNRPFVTGILMISSSLFLTGFLLSWKNFPVLALFFISLTYAAFLAPSIIMVSLMNAYFHEDARATGMAVYNSVIGIGMIVGPLFIGYLVDNGGYTITVAVLAVSCFCTGFCFFTLKDPSLQIIAT